MADNRLYFSIPQALAERALSRRFTQESEAACFRRLLLDLRDAIALKSAPPRPRSDTHGPAPHRSAIQGEGLAEMMQTYSRGSDSRTLHHLLEWAIALPVYPELSGPEIVAEIQGIDHPTAIPIPISEILERRHLGTLRNLKAAIAWGRQQGQIITLPGTSPPLLWIGNRGVSHLQIPPPLTYQWSAIRDALYSGNLPTEAAPRVMAGESVGILFDGMIAALLTKAELTPDAISTAPGQAEYFKTTMGMIGGKLRDRQPVTIQTRSGYYLSLSPIPKP